MRFGRRKRQPTLSVCCVTDRSPEQTAAVLSPLRGVADEVVIGLDRRLADQQAAYAALADRIVVTEPGPIEGSLTEIHAACSGDWVLRIDADEIASESLVARIPALVGDEEAQQFAFARRWLSPDGGGWYDEHPWSPDWQVRLVRRDRATFLPGVHAPIPVVAPRHYLEEPIYHASATLLTPAERRRHMLRREIVLRPGPSTLRQSSAIIYEPERHASRAPVAVPPADRPAIAAFLLHTGRAAPSPPGAPSAASDAPPAAAPSAATTWSSFGHMPSSTEAEAGIALVDPPPMLVSDESTTVIVSLTNRSGETWKSGAARGDRGHAASYRWHLPDGSTEEGVRTLLPGPVQPGQTVTLPVEVIGASQAGPATLAMQLVLEQVRWLDGEARADVDLAPARPVPTSRVVGRDPSAPPIPKILHRVWLGDNPLPADYRAYGESWKKHHPDWEMRLWTEADAPSPPGTDRARSLSERSDLVRYAVLQEYGGVYVDTDVECLRPIDDLLVGLRAFAGYEVPGRVCGAVMGGLPGHPAFDELVDLAEMTTGEGHFPESVTTFVTYVLEAWPDVTLFDPSVFYPELWDDSPNTGAEPPYTDHHWGQSWNPAVVAARAAGATGH